MKKTVIITGAGSLGKGFIDYFLKQKDCEITVVDNNEWALAELKGLPIKLQLDDFTQSRVADLLIHTAAYKHVDLCEENTMSASNNNYYKTENLFKNNKSTTKVFISTDKSVQPTSHYGRTKKQAEEENRGRMHGKHICDDRLIQLITEMNCP